MFDDIRKTVDVQPLKFAGYPHDELYATDNQIVDSNHLLREIDEADSRALAQAFCIYTFNYTSGLMNV